MSVIKVGSELVRCEKPGERRTDNGLDSGVHCQSCWDSMIFECKQRSW